ncbi:MAG: ferritin family protein [Anaerolineae bacterium]|jgi:rubrerythrin
MAILTAAEVLNMALSAEQSGQSFYEAAAEKMEDQLVKDLLRELADWEQQHYQVFREMSDRVGSLPPLSESQWGEYDQYMQAALSNALFRGPDKALAVAEELEDEEEALRMALGFEKDTLLFYYDLREMLPAKERETVDKIIREEKSHALRLGSLLRSGAVVP